MTATYIYPPLDISPDDLYQQFVTYMQTNIPNWQPAQGNLDDWIALAFSFIVAQLNQAASDVATQIFRYFGAYVVQEPPIAATPASAQVTITASDANGPYVIPANTQLIFVDSFGNPQGFETTTAATIPNGSASIAGVGVIATEPGSAGNNITGSAQLVSPLAFVSSAVLTAPTSGGTDDEADDAYVSRLVGLFQTLTPKAISANDFAEMTLQQTGVGRAVAIPGFDPGTQTFTATTASGSNSLTGIASTTTPKIPVGAPISGTGIPVGAYVTAVGSTSITISANATAVGSVTMTVTGSLQNGGEVGVFATDSLGNALSSGAMTTIQSALQAGTVANVLVNVEAPTYTTIAVTATVYAWPGEDATSIQTAVQSAIQQYLSQASWGIPPLGQAATWTNDPVVRVASLEHAILSVPGTHYVSAITVNGGTADVPLQGVVPLPETGTVTVTVNVG